MGVIFSAQSNFSNGAGGSTVIGTVPPGTYGKCPSPFAAAAGKGGSGDRHICRITAGGVDYDADANGSNGTPFTTIFTWFPHLFPMPANWLDGGATISIITQSATSPPPEVGAAAVMIVSSNDVRCDNDHTTAGFRHSFDSGTSISGTFDDGGVFNPVSSNYDANAQYVMGGIALYDSVFSPTQGLASFASNANWTDVASQLNGRASVTIGLWTLPSPVDKSFAITNLAPNEANGFYVFQTINDHVVHTGRGYATIIGD